MSRLWSETRHGAGGLLEQAMYSAQGSADRRSHLSAAVVAEEGSKAVKRWQDSRVDARSRWGRNTESDEQMACRFPNQIEYLLRPPSHFGTSGASGRNAWRAGMSGCCRTDIGNAARTGSVLLCLWRGVELGAGRQRKRASARWG